MDIEQYAHSLSKNPRRALLYAIKAHDGQFRQTGEPYIEHVARVMQRLDQKNESLLVIAALHDAIEDTGVTAEDLEHEGFETQAIQSVVLLTKVPEQAYMDYIHHLADDPLARTIKMADIADNLAHPKPVQTEKAMKKQKLYTQAVEFLESLS